MSPNSKKFLNFSNSIRRINHRYKLRDPKAVLVLEVVLSAYANKASLTVLDLILLKEIASQATLHSVMKALIDNKLIKAEVSKEDGRRKIVTPARLGLAWLRECSDLLYSSSKK